MSLVRAFPVVVLAFALGAAPASAAPDPKLPDGAAAPANSWLMEGGCAARTGVSLTRALAGPVETAWEQQFKGTIEGEPLVADGWVFVCAAEASSPTSGLDTRTLYVLDLAKGAVTAEKTFRTPSPLLPCLGSGFVVVRSAPDRVESFRWKAPRLWPNWHVETPSGVESFVLFAREVYVRHGGTVARYEIGRDEPEWEQTANFRGRLALRGDLVYAVDYETDGTAWAWGFSRASGARMFATRTGFDPLGVPPPSDDTHIAAGDRRAFVRHERPMAARDSAGWNTSLVRTDVAATSWQRNFSGEAAQWGEGFLAIFNEGHGPRLFLTTDAGGPGHVLADQMTRPEFVADPLAVSIADGVAMFAGCAVDLDTREILWRSPGRPAGRMVPARGMVLVRGTEDRLVALRSARMAAAQPRVVTPAPATITGRAGLRDGSVVSGTFTFDAAAGSVTVGTPRRTIALADVLVLESAAGEIVAGAADTDDLARGLDELLEREFTEERRAIVKMAAASRDDALLRRVIAEAWLHGASPADIAEAEVRLKDLTSAGVTTEADPALAERIAGKERAMTARSVAFVRERAALLPAGAPASLRIDLLRITLARDPEDASAVAAVKAMLPAAISPKAPFAAAEWLDFAEALGQCRVEILTESGLADPAMKSTRRTFQNMLASWRPDLVGIRSPQLLLFTPVARPGALARCLSAGELICSSLETMFAKGSRRRASPEPLVLLLYESAREFRRSEEHRNPGHAMSWTSGYYSPLEKLSRLYLPEGDEEFRRVTSVFAHELTHQWIEQRCPLFTKEESRKATPDRPGHWIVEGFAEFVQSLNWDLRGRAWTRNPRSDGAEVVAGAGESALVSWPHVFALSAWQFAQLDRKPKVPIRSGSRLDAGKMCSELNFFYAQSAVACEYLFFAEDGKYREKLIDYVGAYYRGDRTTIDAAFGMSAEELGRRATAFAKEACAK